MNLFNMVKDRSYDQLQRLVRNARAADAKEPLSEEVRDALTRVIVGSCDWDTRPSHESAKEFILPPRRRFYMDGHMGKTFETTPILECRDTGDFWNGWRVPAPTYAELVDYAQQVRELEDEDVFRQFFVALLEMYGGQPDEDGTATHSPVGWCWSLVPEDGDDLD